MGTLHAPALGNWEKRLNAHFSDDDLRRALVARPDHQFVQAFTENLLTYALGRSLDYHDMPAVRGIVRDASPADYSWSAIITGIVTSTPFRMAIAGPAREQ